MRPLRLCKYHLLSLWNWRSSYLSRLIEPVAYFAFLTAGLRNVLQEYTESYLTFALTGMACFLAFRSATATISDVANDRKWGVFALYTLQGGSTLGYLVSILLINIGAFVAQSTLLLFLSRFILGEDIDIHALLPITIKGLLVLIGWAGIGASAGALIQSYAKRDMVVTLTSLPVVLSAPLFYPLSSTPQYLRSLSTINPLTYNVDWLRQLTPQTYYLSILWCIAGILLGWFFLRQSDRVSRER